jgi:molybdopterin-guanine dinucleotide biosynthesis protein A
MPPDESRDHTGMTEKKLLPIYLELRPIITLVMAPPKPLKSQITGVILAGGRAQRMDGIDKGLVRLAGRSLVEHVLAGLRGQVNGIIINANRNHEVYAGFGYPVVADLFEGYCGPLAGMASAMQEATTPFVLTVPCDSPFVPPDLASRLWRALNEQSASIAAAYAEGRLQPVFALIDRDLLPALRRYLESGERKVDRWYAEQRLAVAGFADTPEAFININSFEELAEIEHRLSRRAAP